MSGVALSGLASGMDTNSIIQQVMEIERQPIYSKQSEIQSLQDEKKAWQDIDSKLSALESSISTLQFSSTFNSKLVSSTDEGVVTATATTAAAVNSLTIEDVVLAKPGQISSASALNLSDGVKANTTGTADVSGFVNERFNETSNLTIQEGSFQINEKTITVEEDDTIYLVINKINASGAGVTASIDDSGNFQIEANEASSSRDIEFGSEDTSGFLTGMGLGDKLGTTVENGVSPDYIRTISEVKADNPGSALDTVQSGFFTINGYTFEVDENEDTLNSIISKINKSDAGVTAFYDNDTKNVTLTATEAGDDIILENDTSGFLTSIGVMNSAEDTDSGTGRSVYEGSGSSVRINGVLFEKETNKFNVNGINIELKGETESGEKVDLAIEQDVDKAYEAIKTYIDSYNEVINIIEEKTAKEGVLQGDSRANNLKFRLRTNMTNEVNGVESGYNMISLVGITAESNTSSVLTLDSSKLKEAIEENSVAIEQLFTQQAGVSKITDEIVGTGDGVQTSFYLDQAPSKDDIDSMEITVGGITYTTDGSTYKIITSGDPEENQILVNTVSGELTFHENTAPNGEIKATYFYEDVSATGGLTERMEDYLDPYTVYNGLLDAQTNSIDDRIADMNEWIENYNMRLSIREQSLRAQYTAMEQAISTSNSQSQWLSSQIAGL